ncbi:MAG: hypothetical protein U0325_03695 [Polyangiales bacterium]
MPTKPMPRVAQGSPIATGATIAVATAVALGSTKSRASPAVRSVQATTSVWRPLTIALASRDALRIVIAFIGS